jgi:hypothetical protein
MSVRGSSTRTAEPRRKRELFFSLVGQHLDRLGQVVRRELAGELHPEDVVDGVLHHPLGAGCRWKAA